MQDYDLELDKAEKQINNNRAKTVMIQLPDGLKPRAKEIKQELEQRIKRKIHILFWAGSCFGACDVPAEQAKSLKTDLLIQFGHSQWR